MTGRDRAVTRCEFSGCRKTFGVMVRKHPCRCCGCIFCSEHMQLKLYLAQDGKPVGLHFSSGGILSKVCHGCYEVVASKAERELFSGCTISANTKTFGPGADNFKRMVLSSHRFTDALQDDALGNTPDDTAASPRRIKQLGDMVPIPAESSTLSSPAGLSRLSSPAGTVASNGSGQASATCTAQDTLQLDSPTDVAVDRHHLPKSLSEVSLTDSPTGLPPSGFETNSPHIYQRRGSCVPQVSTDVLSAASSPSPSPRFTHPTQPPHQHQSPVGAASGAGTSAPLPQPTSQNSLDEYTLASPTPPPTLDRLNSSAPALNAPRLSQWGSMQRLSQSIPSPTLDPSRSPQNCASSAPPVLGVRGLGEGSLHHIPHHKLPSSPVSPSLSLTSPHNYSSASHSIPTPTPPSVRSQSVRVASTSQSPRMVVPNSSFDHGRPPTAPVVHRSTNSPVISPSTSYRNVPMSAAPREDPLRVRGSMAAKLLLGLSPSSPTTNRSSSRLSRSDSSELEDPHGSASGSRENTPLSPGRSLGPRTPTTPHTLLFLTEEEIKRAADLRSNKRRAYLEDVYSRNHHDGGGVTRAATAGARPLSTSSYPGLDAWTAVPTHISDVAKTHSPLQRSSPRTSNRLSMLNAADLAMFASYDNRPDGRAVSQPRSDGRMSGGNSLLPVAASPRRAASRPGEPRQTC